MPLPIFLPAPFVVFRADRPLLAIADGRDPFRTYRRLDQGPLNSVRPVISRGQVVFDRSSFVAVALNEQLDIRVLGWELRVLLHGSLLLCSKVGLSQSKKMFLMLAEESCSRLGEAAETGAGGGGAFHGDPRSCRIASSRTFRHQPVGRRLDRSHRANHLPPRC